MRTLTKLLLGGLCALTFSGCGDEVTEKKTSEVKYETARVVESRYNKTGDDYYVVFRCQHGKSLIADRLDDAGKKLWEKHDEGDEIRVPYTEEYEIGYDGTNPEKDAKIKRVIKINHQWENAEKVKKEGEED